MRIKKKHVKQLASLSALGAGALAISAGQAQASIMYYPINPPQQVGWPDGPYGPGYTIQLPGSAQMKLERWSWSRSWSRSGKWGRYGATGVWFRKLTGSVSFARSNNWLLRTFSKGAGWPSPANAGTAASVAGKYWWTTAPTTPSTTCGAKCDPAFGHGTFYQQYALFSFWDSTGSGGQRFGWLQLSNVVGDDLLPGVTLEGWAYDDTGAYIAAGDTGQIPEPSTFVLAGFGALVLGAAGLRRWRAARKA